MTQQHPISAQATQRRETATGGRGPKAGLPGHRGHWAGQAPRPPLSLVVEAHLPLPPPGDNMMRLQPISSYHHATAIPMSSSRRGSPPLPPTPGTSGGHSQDNADEAGQGTAPKRGQGRAEQEQAKREWMVAQSSVTSFPALVAIGSLSVTTPSWEPVSHRHLSPDRLSRASLLKPVPP
jgi:hypothetical protein